MTVIFTIPGEPMAKARARAAIVGGRARMYTPAKTANYEGMVSVLAHEAMAGRKPFDGPVELSFTAVFPIPKSWTKKRRAQHEVSPEWVTKKPDADNLLKAICDGMNGVVFVDDSQVARLGECKKVYGDRPGVTVGVCALDAVSREP